MSATTERIMHTVLSLPDEEKATLVDEILRSMHRSDPAIDRVWDEEIERRLDAYEAGRATTYSAEEVFEELRQA